MKEKKEKLKTREQIITDMCHTWRHDYGLVKDEGDTLSSGMTTQQRQALWNQMAQLFDVSIRPSMKHRKKKSKTLDNLK
jgi:hypothetical protein